ncbi:RbsD / FucU transport protein family protein [Collimonas sp. OK307]|nr:RbsD / FucU transport protein family protein [Collimonas sp. OK307]
MRAYPFLRVALTEMQVQKAVVAQELGSVSPAIEATISSLLPDTAVSQVSHAEFKTMTAGARAIVRTGEFTPYANIILIAGVVF